MFAAESVRVGPTPYLQVPHLVLESLGLHLCSGQLTAELLHTRIRLLKSRLSLTVQGLKLG